MELLKKIIIEELYKVFQEEVFQEEVFQEEVFQEEVFQEEVFQEEVFQEEVFQEEVFQEEVFQEEVFQEERISNKDASEEVRNRRNFVGSHTYGEDIGDLGKIYVAYSYGEQHPLYVWDGVRWYHNNEQYILPNGKPNKWTIKHLNYLKPNNETQGRPTSFLIKLINNFKMKHNIGDNSHTDLAPGEK